MQVETAASTTGAVVGTRTRETTSVHAAPGTVVIAATDELRCRAHNPRGGGLHERR